MPRRRDVWGRCESCGRRIAHGRVCRRCEDDTQRQLDRARGLVDRALVGVGFRGTVGQLRARALPAIRRAAMEGMTLRTAAVRVQARIDRAAHSGGVEAA